MVDRPWELDGLPSPPPEMKTSDGKLGFKIQLGQSYSTQSKNEKFSRTIWHSDLVRTVQYCQSIFNSTSKVPRLAFTDFY